MNKKIYDEELILKVAAEAHSAKKAAELLGIPLTSYRRIAKKLGCYKTNQGGKVINKVYPTYDLKLQEILEGKHPNYQTNHLRCLILQKKIKVYQCECCKLTKWMNRKIPLELHHIDGDKTNHKLENLQLLCPNCHAMTDTYCGKNIRK